MSYYKRSAIVALSLVGFCLLLSGRSGAQTAGQANSGMSAEVPSPEGDGKQIGDFRVTQSVEIGGRISDVNGSQPMYNTLENYQSGARILEQSLTMQSLSHQDLFDTLTLSSFGWGGDPEQAARLRVAKYTWYIFSGSYQHFQNYWNYDLFANPLNPPSGSPSLPILNSPHAYYNRQNLYNFDLVILPMHKLSFRAGYNRNRFDGPAFSTIHEGTEALLNETTDNTLNGFRFGVDYRPLKKTTLSYTQLLQYYDGGTIYGLNPFNSYPLPNGSPVSLGLSWFNGGSPCSMPLLGGTTANPTCNAFSSYSLNQHLNTFIPTEQFNLTSSSLKRIDFNGQFQYSHAQMNTPFNELFAGLNSREATLGSNTAGSTSSAKWNSVSADGSATIHITDRLRLVETFRFRNFSVAGDFLNLQANYFNSASLGGASLLYPIASFPATNLFHNPGAPADIVNEFNVNLAAQNTKQNDFQAQYDITRSFGVRAGFLWTNDTIQPGESYQAALGDIYYPIVANRGNCPGPPLNPDGSCTFTGVIAPWGGPTTTINRYSGLVGAWFRQGTALDANLNVQYGQSDNWVYRIDPIGFFKINGNFGYAPRPWLTFGGNLLLQHSKNDSSDLAYNQHNYSVMFDTTVMPNAHWGLDVGYSFDAIQQNTNVCFAGTVVPTNSYTCNNDPTLLETYGFYETHTQYGNVAVTLNPVNRVNLRLGYSIVDNQGSTTIFNPLLPPGPLASTFQSPLAAIDVAVHKNVTFKGGWNYYQYADGAFVGPTASRYFHANLTTLGLQYAF